jgi:pyruvate formate lyase activating enzyme
MKKEWKGTIFDIQRYSIHDGEGIRTLVFMKGCPLRCRWCSNPEGLEEGRNLLYHTRLCYGCGRCAAVCKAGAIQIEEGQIVWNRELCTECMRCAEACSIVHARQVCGRVYTEDELLDTIAEDSVYYYRSNGGVTFGGGEPMLQAEFVSHMMERCHEELGINTAVETSSCAPEEKAELIYRAADYIFTDVKHMDADRHKELTGVGNAQILKNIRRAAEILDEKRQTLVLRIPVIPGLNDTEENIRETADFAKHIGNVTRIELLPYHNLGESKYQKLRRTGDYPLHQLKPPAEEHMEQLRLIAEAQGIMAKTGSL